jgi:predicted restriction endonuclease
VEEASAERRPPVQEEEEVLVLRKQEEDELSERMIGSTAPSYLGSEQRWHHQMRRQSKQGTLTKSPTNSSFFKYKYISTFMSLVTKERGTERKENSMLLT